MKKVYTKPEIEIIEMDEIMETAISQIGTTGAAPDNEGGHGSGLEAGGSDEEVPECSKGGFPWEDGFGFEMQ